MSHYLSLWPLSGTIALLLPGKILIPPPHEPALFRHPLHPCAQFTNGEIRDIFCNGSLPPPNVLLNWPHPCRLQGLHHWWTLLYPLPDLPIWHPCDPLSQSMTEPLQYLHNIIHNYPTLTPIKYHRLNQHLVHHQLCTYHISCLHQHLLHHPHFRCTLLIFL